MKRYSQNNEQDIILKYFKNKNNGIFLDIGAFAPFDLSNTRALYELGWKGVFVEPSHQLIEAFIKEYDNDEEIELVEKCIGTYNGIVTFYDSNGDAVGTTDEKHRKLWSKRVKFTKTRVPIITVNTLLKECVHKTFDFINIDTEGNCLEIFKQFNFNSVGCKAICVEHNQKDKEIYCKIANKQGFKEIDRNGENFIFAK